MILLRQREFAPPLWATALFLVLGITMLLLGRWQLQRAALKIRLADEAQTALDASPASLPQIIASQPGLLIAPVTNDSAGTPTRTSASAFGFRRVSVSGHVMSSQQFLWDNRIHQGRAGFEVLVPVRVSSGSGGQSFIVMVNRGWVPAGTTRSSLPDIGWMQGDKPDAQQTTSGVVASAGSFEVQLEGLLTQPSKGFASGDVTPFSADAGAQWPKLAPFLDYPAMARHLGEPVVVGLLQNITAIEPARAGFLRLNNWQPVASGPEKHYGYAFQWFAMFIALGAIYLVTNSRKIEDRQ